MVSLFLVFSLVMCVFFLICNVKKCLEGYSHDDNICIRYTALFVIFGILSMILVACIDILANFIASEDTINEQIAKYESQNLHIKNDINTVLKRYDIKLDDNVQEIITFLFDQPELETNAVLQQNIEEYSRNYEKLVELQRKKTFLPKAKWELYFGG